MIKGEGKHELEVNVPASKAWELYGTLRLAKLVDEQLSSVISKTEVVHGDGGLGSVIHIFFVPGTPGFSSYKEKFTKIDNDNRIKETEVVEGGYLDLGFTLFRVRFEILDKGDDCSCIIRTTIEYELNDDSAANASLVSIDSLAAIALVAKDHLTKPVPNQHP